MNKHTYRAVQLTVQFLFYTTVSALILLTPALAGLIFGGELSA